MSPQKGADTAIYLASSPDVDGITGQYFGKRKQLRISDAASDSETAMRLWDASEMMTGMAGKSQGS